MIKKIHSVNDILSVPNWRETYVEMVEPDALGRRWLLGFKRRNAKRSRKGKIAFLCRPPQNLDEILAGYEKLKLQIIAAEKAAD